jgi:acetyl-CoA C-acetyltransferase
MIAEKWDISREEMEAFAIESHTRALKAQAEGPLRGRDRAARRPRPRRGPPRAERREDPSLRTLVEGGRLTAAVASQISDASAAMLIASEQAVKDHGLNPAGPHPPHERARRRSDLHAHRPDPGHPLRPREDGHVDRRHRPVEINEAFASVVLAWQRSSTPTWRRSTSTAAPSPSATRSARPAPA